MSDSIDWGLCVICQNSSKEHLQCPANQAYRRSDIGSGYATLAENLEGFKELGVLTPPTQLEYTSNLQDVLLSNKAKWHKSCQLKYNSTKLQRLQKRSHEDTDVEDQSERRKSIRIGSEHEKETKFPRKCFFCDSDSTDQPMHSVTTFEVDRRVRKIATDTDDAAILAKLSAGDMIAIEAVYHTKCLSTFYNRSRAQETSQSNADGVLHGIALAEILAYINEEKNENSVTVFKLADLVKMYSNRLEQLGVVVEFRIHSTNFKDRILSSCPNLVAYKRGRDVFISFRDDVGAVLSNAYVDDDDDEGTYLAKAANIVRRDILNTISSFDGIFDENSKKTLSQELFLLWSV